MFFKSVWVEMWIWDGIIVILFYDFMLVKIIVYGKIWEEVFLKLSVVLKEIRLYGVIINF